MKACHLHLGQLCNNWFAALSKDDGLGGVPGIYWKLKLKLPVQQGCCNISQ
jgi:hypothetical protein